MKVLTPFLLFSNELQCNEVLLLKVVSHIYFQFHFSDTFAPNIVIHLIFAEFVYKVFTKQLKKAIKAWIRIEFLTF